MSGWPSPAALDALSGRVDLDLDLPEAYRNSINEIQVVACGTSYHGGRPSVTRVRRQG